MPAACPCPGPGGDVPSPGPASFDPATSGQPISLQEAQELGGAIFEKTFFRTISPCPSLSIRNSMDNEDLRKPPRLRTPPAPVGTPRVRGRSSALGRCLTTASVQDRGPKLPGDIFLDRRNRYGNLSLSDPTDGLLARRGRPTRVGCHAGHDCSRCQLECIGALIIQRFLQSSWRGLKIRFFRFFLLGCQFRLDDSSPALWLRARGRGCFGTRLQLPNSARPGSG